MRLPSVAAALAGSLLLAGCGGGADRDPGPAPSTPADSPTAGASTTTDPHPAEVDLRAPSLATSGEELGRRLAAAEEAARLAGATDQERDQAAFDIQVLVRQLARRPGWQAAALTAAGAHRATVEEHLEARSALRSVLSALSPQLPAWRVADPAPVADLRRFYREGQRRFDVPWEVLAAINLVETGFGKIHGYSTAGARGPMQFIASTWAAYGRGDIDDPHDAILAAARYLAANGAATPSRLDGALHAYNRHTGYVRGVRAYARILERDPSALDVLHRWQIIFLSARGDVWIPVGYDRSDPIAVDRYLTRHPDRLLSPATN